MGATRHLSLVSASAEIAMEPTRRLLLSAILETPTARYPVLVRDLAADTALVQGERLPRKGALVCLRRGMTEVFGEVNWLEGDEASIEFDEVVDLDRFRNGGIRCAAPASEPYRRPGLNRGSEGDVSDGAGSLAAAGGAQLKRRDLSDL